MCLVPQLLILILNREMLLSERKGDGFNFGNVEAASFEVQGT